MPSNVEIKAKLRDRETVERLVSERADHGPELIVQEDVFFPSESGRLKLRKFSDDSGELIFYRRLDTEGPTESEFFKAPTNDPAAMATAMMAATLGVLLAQPLGPIFQATVTTQPDVGKLRITSVSREVRAGVVIHSVHTEV